LVNSHAAGKSNFKTCRVGQQGRDPGELKFQFKSKGHLL
jgi:hypothetical protein